MALIAAGDIVPADCRLIESRDLFADQALLTGEPYPAEKHSGGVGDGSAPAKADGWFRRRPRTPILA